MGSKVAGWFIASLYKLDNDAELCENLAHQQGVWVALYAIDFCFVCHFSGLTPVTT